MPWKRILNPIFMHFSYEDGVGGFEKDCPPLPCSNDGKDTRVILENKTRFVVES
jgi:hypothetical protein